VLLLQKINAKLVTEFSVKSLSLASSGEFL